jgi:hypothetical protein
LRSGCFFSGVFGVAEALVAEGVLGWGVVGGAGEVFFGSGFAAALVVDLAWAGAADSVFSFADLGTGVFSGFIIVDLGDPIENACKEQHGQQTPSATGFSLRNCYNTQGKRRKQGRLRLLVGANEVGKAIA